MRWGVMAAALGAAAAGCDDPERTPCDRDRDCALGATGDAPGVSVCAGISRCDDGYCAAPVAAHDPEGRCAAGQGTCSADGLCLPWAAPVLHLPCPVIGTAVLPWIPLGQPLPLRSPDEEALSAVEVSFSAPHGVPGRWERVAGATLDLSDWLAASEVEGHHALHLRAGESAASCPDATGRFDFEVIHPAGLPARLPALRHSHAERLVAHDDPRLTSWAVACLDYEPGEAVDPHWQRWIRALGPASGDPFDVLSLGEGGSAIFALGGPVTRGPGPELVVFENAVPADFIELAFVEVSSDGLHFLRFDSLSLIEGPVDSYDVTEASLTVGLAGAAPLGMGVAFDLDDLRHHPDVQLGLVDLDAIRFVRVVDVIGDGSARDSVGGPIFDPYPTVGSAGFDLQAIGILGR